MTIFVVKVLRNVHEQRLVRFVKGFVRSVQESRGSASEREARYHPHSVYIPAPQPTDRINLDPQPPILSRPHLIDPAYTVDSADTE